MWYLDFRTSDVGGPVAATPALWNDNRLVGHGLAAFPASGSALTFVIHGFNNNRRDGVKATRGFTAAALAQVPALGGSDFIGVLWPGDAVTGFLSYPTEESDADLTAHAFARALRNVTLPRTPHFVAHSLGCRVLLKTLDLLTAADAGRAWADQVVMMAAAVDNDSLARDDRYLDGTVNASRVVNVASKEDAVLRFAYPLGDLFARVFTSGYTVGALGRYGPAPKPKAPASVRALHISSHHGVGHGDYMRGENSKQKRAALLAGHALTQAEPLQF